MKTRHHDTPPPAVLPLPAASNCDIWHVRADQPWLSPEGLRSHLISSERDRADGYRLAEPRVQFERSRGSLRLLLSRYLQCEPLDVPLTVDAFGKPCLTSPSLHFNVAHSGEVLLLAVAGRRIGVDVERVRPMPHAAGLVSRFFAVEEQACYAALPEELQRAGFFRGWTCKEALLKAIGVGVREMDRCAVDLDPRNPPRVLRCDDAGDWHIQTWDPLGGYVAAVIAEC